MANSITFEPVPHGYRIFKGPFLLGVMTTRQHHLALDGQPPMQPDEVRARAAGVVVWTDMPKESWSVHWTSGHMSLEDVAAVTAALPKTAKVDHPQHKTPKVA